MATAARATEAAATSAEVRMDILLVGPYRPLGAPPTRTPPGCRGTSARSERLDDADLQVHRGQRGGGLGLRAERPDQLDLLGRHVLPGVGALRHGLAVHHHRDELRV